MLNLIIQGLSNWGGHDPFEGRKITFLGRQNLLGLLLLSSCTRLKQGRDTKKFENILTKKFEFIKVELMFVKFKMLSLKCQVSDFFAFSS